MENIGYQGQDAIFGAVYAHKRRTKKLQCHGLHRFALDQPSINGIGPINRSEKWKRSETVGNIRKHDQAKTSTTRNCLKKFLHNASLIVCEI